MKATGTLSNFLTKYIAEFFEPSMDVEDEEAFNTEMQRVIHDGILCYSKMILGEFLGDEILKELWGISHRWIANALNEVEQTK